MSEPKLSLIARKNIKVCPVSSPFSSSHLSLKEYDEKTKEVIEKIHAAVELACEVPWV
jgi:hypothetical protein